MTNNIDRAAEVIRLRREIETLRDYCRKEATVSHADTLRGMASGSHPGLSYSAVVALIAGVEALETVGRVRHALSSIARVRAASEAARDYGYDNPEWHGTTADALEYALTLITEALEGDTDE